MTTKKPKNVHVLFVHGVGAHSRLSSQIQAYQALRSNIRNSEPPTGAYDPIDSWKLTEFDEGSGIPGIPYLKLEPNTVGTGGTEAVYLYEVNYSALAGVVRANHPLDLTALFVGFDLAVNISRAYLRKNKPASASSGRLALDHEALALTVQKLGGVFVAATVPILGLPSVAFRRFTESLVGVFSRFFEDIATYALDVNGEGLISAHVDKTVQAIVESPCFKSADSSHSRDMLVIAAHSLGTVVTHSYLVRHRYRLSDYLPERVLTFGSPVSLICWLWLFLDFHKMDFDRPKSEMEKPDGSPDINASRYFIWNPFPAPDTDPPLLHWVNVVNHLDPIATAIPLDYVDLSRPPDANARSLDRAQVHNQFIDTGSSPGAAHTAYFDDRDGFLRILGVLASLLDPAPPTSSTPAPAPRLRDDHWAQGIATLAGQRCTWWLWGVLTVVAYLSAVVFLGGSLAPLALLPLYVFPPLTIGALAFCQRLICSKPTQRTSVEAIENMPWTDLRSYPHAVRQSWRRTMTPLEEKAYVLAPRPGWAKKLAMWVLSFLPTLGAMLLPVLVVVASDGYWHKLVFDHYGKIAIGMLAIFTIYVVAFAISELCAHWRAVVIEVTRPKGQAPSMNASS